ncbi:hypothetical protein LPJ74_004120 [Coemansia sp. RSA 1843]|nr:hypothetical protein LPJ74_004120 [Coemansia sp. RSA 1843]
MSELVQGVKLKFELPFKIPTPVSFPFESIGTFRPITCIPKYDYSLEKTIMKEISKRKQEDQYDQLRQAQQQLSMVDLIASRKTRHKGKEPDRNAAAFGTSSEPSSILARPSSEGGMSRPQKDKAAHGTTSSGLPPPSSSPVSTPSGLSNAATGQKTDASMAGTNESAAVPPGSSTQQQQYHHAPAVPQPSPATQQGSHVPERPQSAGSAINNAQQSTHFPVSSAVSAGGSMQAQLQPQVSPNSAVQTQPPITASPVIGGGGLGYVPNGQNTQRPPTQMQYFASPQQPSQQQQMFRPANPVVHQAQRPLNNNLAAYPPISSSGNQQSIMQPASPLVPVGSLGRPQMFPSMANIPQQPPQQQQQQQHANIPSPDLRYGNRYSTSFGASPAVTSAPASSSVSASAPTLPPKPDELKPHAHMAAAAGSGSSGSGGGGSGSGGSGGGSGTSQLPSSQAVTTATPISSTGADQPHFRHGYGPRAPPALPRRRDGNQNQQPPALPPKPFASFSEFDYTSDGPGALGTSSQDEHVEQLNTLLSMGFSRPHAIHALEMYDYDVNMASNYLIDKSS